MSDCKREEMSDSFPYSRHIRPGCLRTATGNWSSTDHACQGKDQRRLYPLLDALTMRPLLDEKGNQAFSESLGSMMRADRQDRRIIASLVKGAFDQTFGSRKENGSDCGGR